MNIIKTIDIYYKLTKPGIIRGNLISATAGFLLASKGIIDGWLLFYTLFGIALIIASGCVFNNYIDRDIDKKMERTSKRAIPAGDISGKNAMVFATTLGLLGVATLYQRTNYLTVMIGLAGLFFYVVVYGYFKRTSIYGTLVGSISGALPPVAGYIAVTNSIDLGAVLLFLILVTWQMPHFYAIAIYRSKDYKSASLPVMPVVSGNNATKKHIIFYMCLYLLCVALLGIFGYAGITYFITIFGIGLWWLYLGFKGFSTADDNKWALGIFKSSLLVLITFSFMISINSFVP